MNRKELERQVFLLGWRLIVSPDFRRQDCILYTDEVAIQAERNGFTVTAEAVGDVRIIGKRVGYKRTEGSRLTGIPTWYLRRHGRWENKNRFEIFTTKDHEDIDSPYCEKIAYSLDEAAEDFIEALKGFNRAEQATQKASQNADLRNCRRRKRHRKTQNRFPARHARTARLARTQLAQ